MDQRTARAKIRGGMPLLHSVPSVIEIPIMCLPVLRIAFQLFIYSDVTAKTAVTMIRFVSFKNLFYFENTQIYMYLLKLDYFSR